MTVPIVEIHSIHYVVPTLYTHRVEWIGQEYPMMNSVWLSITQKHKTDILIQNGNNNECRTQDTLSCFFLDDHAFQTEASNYAACQRLQCSHFQNM